jgi:hypothetical protein
VSKDRPLISEVDLTSSDFPIIRANVATIDAPEVPPPDLETAISQAGIVGDHPVMREALEAGAMLAASNVPILIEGETGTGKELFARFVHRLSGRDPFVPINCATIPSELVESMRFGHRKGAFTGAISDQTGKFDAADGGTLFLDGLGELPLPTQAKLLRVLQDGQVESIGAKRAHRVDARLIAATNQDIRKAIPQRRFRGDLYYRLNVGEIRLPPLRERRSDIPKIALHVLDHVNAGLSRPKRVSQRALSRLQSQPWPGNVRDLENVIIEDFVITRGDTLRNPHFHDADRLEQFDCVIANPPFSLKVWGRDTWVSDPYGRNRFGLPPKSNGDFAWVLHMLTSMRPDNGRVAVVLPHGSLFRGGQEGKIRTQILDHDLLEAIVGLGPNLFYGTGIPAAILVFRAAKPESLKDQVLFVDASDIYTEGRAQNNMTVEQADEIYALYRERQEVDGKVRLVSRSEIADNDDNLNIARYVQKVTDEQTIPVSEALKDFKARMSALEAAESRLETLLKHEGFEL